MADEVIAKKATRVLVIFAHPDDAEFTAGGTLAKWASEGKEINYVVCTDGSKGAESGEMMAEELVARRQNEQRQAARVLGVGEVIFLGHTDGELTPDEELKAELVRLIRTRRPSMLLTWDPWCHYQLHSDHRAVGQATLDAVMAAAGSKYLPEQLRDGLHPHWVKEVYLFGTDSPDLWVDISYTFGRKIEAITQHISQVSDTAEIEKEIGDWNKSLGESKGFAYAEAFKVLRPHCEICH